MKNSIQESRRNFLATGIKGTAILGAGALFGGAAILPLQSLAQSSSDAEYRNKIAAIGTTSLQTSKLALTKASNPMVKMFAKFEAAEQEAMGGILKDMGTTVPSPKPADAELLPMLQRLNGKAFDKAYISGQIKGHQNLKMAVTAYHNATADINAKHITSLALATINEHIELTQDLLKRLG
ncbi:DUF4142 domain-containing protein [Mucilaginibacter ginkgonis]|uniref:DUF4142 domain-containing protein n=1 Tax=Mucilaginibacter ginkgonis TaxID=2682091 RepID=A0A6I4I147_9SPHI|nr:DUF4142 domain-containing protein [Mucilaginibacter ginkgonis]QQL50467.1 DUF4142 domain-containing protein [Mucilaginibacter ginkgonis]